MEVRALTGDVTSETKEILVKLGVELELIQHGAMETHSPITGELIGRVRAIDAASTKAVIAGADDAFRVWRMTPSPRRGELVRLLGEELRAAKHELARLVTIEAGKIISEKSRRSSGDDRHLRLRRRSIAAALWSDNRH